MFQTIDINSDEITSQVKLSCKLPEIMEEIVKRKLILEAAVELGITVNNNEIQQTADSIRLSHNFLTSEDTFVWLEKYALSIEDFERIAYYSLISQKLATYLFADKVKPYFLENKLIYTSILMYEIIVEDKDLADNLFDLIKEEKKSFFDLARKYIQDVDLRRQLGYKGIVKSTDLAPEFLAPLLEAKPPQILQPIYSAAGHHLILVDEIITPTLDDFLYNQILLDLFNHWLKQRVQLFKLRLI